MATKDLKEMVGANKVVRFAFYRDKNLWYRTECGYEFPVPIKDIGNATFMAEDRALLFMRYIRKHLALKAIGAEAKLEVPLSKQM